MNRTYNKPQVFKLIEDLNLDPTTYSNLVLFIDYVDESDPMTEIVLCGLGSLLEYALEQNVKVSTYELLKASTELYSLERDDIKRNYERLNAGVPLTPPLMPLNDDNS